MVSAVYIFSLLGQQCFIVFDVFVFKVCLFTSWALSSSAGLTVSAFNLEVQFNNVCMVGFESSAVFPWGFLLATYWDFSPCFVFSFFSFLLGR